MNIPPAVATGIHWLHLTAAITAIGVTLTLRLIVHRCVHLVSDEEARAAFERGVRRKATGFIHGSLVLLFITGVFNMMLRLGQQPSGLYVGLLMAKFVLAMAVIGLGIALTIDSDAMGSFRAKRPFWMLVNLLLALAVVLISATLRMLPAGE